ncbi:MAG TPA: GreA/GreB family elongation factor [Candidatus Udaeobacter sp.]|nr:GreA/GreB family elongation factor [Candidatus Udaeobacter sp.]
MQVPYRKPGKYSQIKSDPLLTEGKILELQNKLDRLKNFTRPKAAEEVKRLAELGDFSENVEYQLAKGRLRGINDNILKIENQLKNAVVIPNQKHTDTVELGHKVTIQNERGVVTFQILGSVETNPQQGIISHNSPIGAALMGHKVGEIIKIKTNTKEVEYKIIKIE